jgi:agmatinase
LTHYYPADSLKSPRFSGIPTFMRLPVETDPSKIDVAILGIPFDSGVSYRPGARFGPRDIRVQSALIRPYNPELKVDPFKVHRVADFGDVDANPFSIDDALRTIHRRVSELLNRRVVPVAVGGDHTITLPILRAMRETHGPVAVIHFDAHLDTWDSYFGSQYTHGTWFRRAVDEGLVVTDRSYQVGLRSQVYGEGDFDFSRKVGFRMVTTEEVKAGGVQRVVEAFRGLGDTRVHVSMDIDFIDPAFAPGTGTPQVGGLDSFEALQLVRGLRGLNIVGVDLVEVSPAYDSGGITSLLAANLLYEFLCILPVGRR